MIPVVAASEPGGAQTPISVRGCRRCWRGVERDGWRRWQAPRPRHDDCAERLLEGATGEGESPVGAGVVTG